MGPITDTRAAATGGVPTEGTSIAAQAALAARKKETTETSLVAAEAAEAAGGAGVGAPPYGTARGPGVARALPFTSTPPTVDVELKAGMTAYKAGMIAHKDKNYTLAKEKFSEAANVLNLNGILMLHIYLREGWPTDSAVVKKDSDLAEKLALMAFLLPSTEKNPLDLSKLRLPSDRLIMECSRQLKPLISLEGFRTYDELMGLIRELYSPTYINSFNSATTHLYNVYQYLRTKEGESTSPNQLDRRRAFMYLVINIAEEADDERVIDEIKGVIAELLAKSKSAFSKKTFFSSSEFLDKLTPLCSLLLNAESNVLAIHCAAKAFVKKLEAEASPTATHLLNLDIEDTLPSLTFDDAATAATTRTAATCASRALTAKTSNLLRPASFRAIGPGAASGTRKA